MFEDCIEGPSKLDRMYCPAVLHYLLAIGKSLGMRQDVTSFFRALCTRVPCYTESFLKRTTGRLQHGRPLRELLLERRFTSRGMAEPDHLSFSLADGRLRNPCIHAVDTVQVA